MDTNDFYRNFQQYPPFGEKILEKLFMINDLSDGFPGLQGVTHNLLTGDDKYKIVSGCEVTFTIATQTINVAAGYTFENGVLTKQPARTLVVVAPCTVYGSGVTLVAGDFAGVAGAPDVVLTQQNMYAVVTDSSTYYDVRRGYHKVENSILTYDLEASVEPRPMVTCGSVFVSLTPYTIGTLNKEYKLTLASSNIEIVDSVGSTVTLNHSNDSALEYTTVGKEAQLVIIGPTGFDSSLYFFDTSTSIKRVSGVTGALSISNTSTITLGNGTTNVTLNTNDTTFNENVIIDTGINITLSSTSSIVNGTSVNGITITSSSITFNGTSATGGTISGGNIVAMNDIEADTIQTMLVIGVSNNAKGLIDTATCSGTLGFGKLLEWNGSAYVTSTTTSSNPASAIYVDTDSVAAGERKIMFLGSLILGITLTDGSILYRSSTGTLTDVVPSDPTDLYIQAVGVCSGTSGGYRRIRFAPAMTIVKV